MLVAMSLAVRRILPRRGGGVSEPTLVNPPFAKNAKDGAPAVLSLVGSEENGGRHPPPRRRGDPRESKAGREFRSIGSVIGPAESYCRLDSKRSGWNSEVRGISGAKIGTQPPT